MRLVLVGGSVSASSSPAIHREMMRLAGVEGSYETMDCESDDVVRVVGELREGRIQGINVTMPHKPFAATLCDMLEGPAERSGSVNTLRLVDQEVEGRSTDSTVFGELFAESLTEGEAILVLGSGGTAAAALAAADERPLYVSGRNRAASRSLAARFGAATVPWGTGVAGALTVNATPVGTSGESLPHNVLSAASGVIDLPYAPETTPVVEWCIENDVWHVAGFDFLVRQAVHSFNLWAESDLEFETVRSAL